MFVDLMKSVCSSWYSKICKIEYLNVFLREWCSENVVFDINYSERNREVS